MLSNEMTEATIRAALRANPYNAVNQMIAADYFDDHCMPAEALLLRKGRLPINDAERSAADILGGQVWPKIGVYSQARRRRAIKNLCVAVDRGWLSPYRMQMLWEYVWHFKRFFPHSVWKYCPDAPTRGPLFTPPDRAEQGELFRRADEVSHG